MEYSGIQIINISLSAENTKLNPCIAVPRPWNYNYKIEFPVTWVLASGQCEYPPVSGIINKEGKIKRNQTGFIKAG